MTGEQIDALVAIASGASIVPLAGVVLTLLGRRDLRKIREHKASVER